MRRLIPAILLLNIFAVTVVWSQQDTEPTQPVPNTEELQLLTLIRNHDLQTDDPDKVAQAIESLGNKKCVVAIDDLIPLLSFSRIYSWEKANSGIQVHPVTVDDRYPAVGDLAQIGKPSVPALLKVIGNNDSSELVLKNAAAALMLIYRDNPIEGLKLLRESAEHSKTVESAQRLRKAGKEALQWCLPSERAQCEAALNNTGK